MSFLSKTVLIFSGIVSIGIITYVHYAQQNERNQLHLGVIRDIERQQRKKENLQYLQEHIKFAKEMKIQEAELMKKS